MNAESVILNGKKANDIMVRIQKWAEEAVISVVMGITSGLAFGIVVGIALGVTTELLLIGMYNTGGDDGRD